MKTQIQKVITAASQVGRKLIAIVNKTLSALGRIGPFSKKLSFAVVPRPQIYSPFNYNRKNAYLLFNKTEASSTVSDGSQTSSGSSLQMYCVDCGFNGSTTLAGGLTYTISEYH